MNQPTGDSNNNEVVFHQRIRFTLLDKKEVVYSFYNFLEEPNNIEIRLLDRELAIKAFLKYQNNNQQSLNDADEKAQVHIIKKWIEAERRAEYLDWNGTNNLSNKTCQWEKVVIKQIDFILKNRDMRCAEFNQISKRSSSKLREFGVIARKQTPAGTFLGFYKGKCITSQQVRYGHTFNYDNLFYIGKGQFISGNEFLSCYGRYYRCSVSHNVCVKRLLLWTDPQKALCFITTKLVEKDEEFLIPHGCEDWEEQNVENFANDDYRRVSNRLMDRVPPGNYPQEDTLYTSQEAQTMSLLFGDNNMSPFNEII